MKNKNLVVRLIYGLIMLFLCSLTAFATTDSPSKTEKIIKIGSPIQYGFVEYDENHNLSGYTYDFLMKISQRTGWKYEFVTYEFTNQGILQSLSDLEQGKVDICGAMTYSDKLAETYEYSKIPYGYTDFVLLTDENNKKLNSRSIDEYNDFKIALVETATGQNKLLIDYCNDKGIKFTPIYVKSSDECRQLLDEGKADALVSKNVVASTGYKIIAYIGKQPFYFAVNKANVELVKEIDKILEEINITHPNYTAETHQKYFTNSDKSDLALSFDEMAFLEAKPIIRATIMENMPPWQYYDTKAKKYSGIVVDILNQISEKSGLAFEYIPVKNMEEARTKIKNNEADIISLLPAYFPLSDEYDVLITSPLMSVPIVYISNLSSSNKPTTAILSSEIAIMDKTHKYTTSGSTEELFQLIDNGSYTNAYLDGYSAQHLMATNSYTNITLATLPYSSYDVGIGVSRACDIRVINILEQAISIIPNSKIESIVYENTTHSHESSLTDVIKRNPIESILIIAAILGIIIILLINIFLRTRKLNKLISQEKNKYMHISETDRLTKTYNNATFKSLAKGYVENSIGKPLGALLVCDIDNFKQINDNYGHLMGDEVIAKIAEIMLGTFREDDIIGRWGGDEMVALLKNITDENIIAMRCEELLHKCAKISDEFKITLSIGAIVFSENEKFDILFQKADEALYIIKNNNKNGYKIVN